MSLPQIDLLRLPVAGRFFRWKHARTVLQASTLSIALVIMVDGWFGPDIGPLNIAGVVPWVHWRGFVVLALLMVGNLFCMACPFMLVRRPAKKWFGPTRAWPKALKSKWLAIAILAGFFWAYEAFDLWESPWLAAWITATYFVMAFTVDAFFRGAAFCKYLCPIGHFHFVSSTASPFEVAVRDYDQCARCTTKDCIKGRYTDRTDPKTLVQNGCELWLFQERKVGNMDCTFCMECIHACPHDNVGILSRTPAAELWDDPRRSGIGRFSERPDIGALVVFLAFAAFLNAFGMVAPAGRFRDWMEASVGVQSEAVATAANFLVGVGLLPLLLVGAATLATRWITSDPRPLKNLGARWALTLAPIGFGMWMAHHLMHFLMSGGTLGPVLRSRFLGASLAPGMPHVPTGAPGSMPMAHSGAVKAALVPETWIHPIALIGLEVGMLVSVFVAYKIGQSEYGPNRRALVAALPWMALVVLLAVAGAWLLVQPMEMRGMLG